MSNLLPTVAEIFAERDANAKAAAEQLKAQKDDFDRITLLLVQENLSNRDNVEYIENAGKRGYRIRIADSVGMDSLMRAFGDFCSILPMLRAQANSNETITCEHDGNFVRIIVME